MAGKFMAAGADGSANPLPAFKFQPLSRIFPSKSSVLRGQRH
ncbi:MAG: hypothetical protein AAFY83_03470 [Pseudomonadota bacterium]